MSIRSLADFMEVSPRSVRRLDSTATVTGRGDPHVDASARGADFSWPKTGTSGGHQCGLFMAISADFLVATDSTSCLSVVVKKKTARWDWVGQEGTQLLRHVASFTATITRVPIPVVKPVGAPMEPG
jgi:hypothetical protein